MKTLEQNGTYTLRLEYMKPSQGGWWLELIERSTGMTRILTSLDKNMFEGVTIEHAKRWMKSVEPKKIYKAGKV